MNNIYGIIYKVTCLPSQKIYIGQTIDTLSERRSKHYYKAKHEKELNTHFLNALRFYKSEDFKWEVIDTAKNREELNEKEDYWINYYDSIKNGYNIRKGGETRLGDDKFAEACGSKPFLVFTNKGKYIGEYINKRQVERELGILHSDISKMILDDKGSSHGYIVFDKEKYTEEKLQQRIKIANIGHYDNFYAINKKTGKQFGPFTTPKECSETLKINGKHIKEVLNNVRKSTAGYMLKYEEDL